MFRTLVRSRPIAATAAIVSIALAAVGCGASSTPDAAHTLSRYLAAADHGDARTMRALAVGADHRILRAHHRSSHLPRATDDQDTKCHVEPLSKPTPKGAGHILKRIEVRTSRGSGPSLSH